MPAWTIAGLLQCSSLRDPSLKDWETPVHPKQCKQNCDESVNAPPYHSSAAIILLTSCFFWHIKFLSCPPSSSMGQPHTSKDFSLTKLATRTIGYTTVGTSVFPRLSSTLRGQRILLCCSPLPFQITYGLLSLCPFLNLLLKTFLLRPSNDVFFSYELPHVLFYF